MSECVKVGNAVVCVPDDEERISESFQDIYDCFSELLDAAEELEEQRHTLESGLLVATNQLLALVKELNEVRLKERKIRYSCECAKAELDKIAEWRKELQEEVGSSDKKEEEHE